MPARLVMCISVQKQIAQKWVQHDSSNCFLERLFAVICRKFTVKFLVFTNLQVPVFYTVSTAANWTLLKCLHTMITNVLMLFVIGVAWGGVRGGGAPSVLEYQTNLPSLWAEHPTFTRIMCIKMHYCIPFSDERMPKYSERGLTPFPDLTPLICQTSKCLRPAAKIQATPASYVEIEMQTDCLRSCFCLRLSVCWFVDLSISKVTPKVVDGFLWNWRTS